MTIETDLTRIAAALERMASALEARQPAAALPSLAPAAASPAAPAEPAAANQESAAEAPAAAADAPITLDVLRARFRDLSVKGRRDQLMAIIESYGVDRLPLVDAKHYPAIAQQIAALEAA